ncbi:hypothetical protein AAHC03_019254 [Spirometra sp. Aus1]
MMGGKSPLTPEDLKDALFQEALAAALKELGDKSGGCASYSMEEFLSGTKQVVAGAFYEWTMRVKQTPLANNAKCLEWCSVACQEKPTYSASVWMKPYRNDPKKAVVTLEQV